MQFVQCRLKCHGHFHTIRLKIRVAEPHHFDAAPAPTPGQDNVLPDPDPIHSLWSIFCKTPTFAHFYAVPVPATSPAGKSKRFHANPAPQYCGYRYRHKRLSFANRAN
jgi:hypothetical protein